MRSLRQKSEHLSEEVIPMEPAAGIKRSRQDFEHLSERENDEQVESEYD